MLITKFTVYYSADGWHWRRERNQCGASSLQPYPTELAAIQAAAKVAEVHQPSQVEIPQGLVPAVLEMYEVA